MASGVQAADMEIGEIGRVASVTDGDTLVLQSGLRVKLAAITAPARAEPFGREAQEGLAGLLRGRRVQLSYGGDPRDRYDRALAHVHTLTPAGERDFWVQDEMVRLGLARVYTWPEEAVDFKMLYATEMTARSRSRGLWSDPAYAVRSPDPDPLAQYVDSLQIVEGIITQTAEVRGRTYLNFGADYRTDFTILIAQTHKKQFADMDLLALEGARVRVRGWVELMNGPMMWANHPARIETLS
jgi:endonuclease YncB( thermonuclease family)